MVSSNQLYITFEQKDKFMRIFAFAGSLRKESLNHQLAKIIGYKLQDLKFEVDLAKFSEFDMPLFDGDLQSASGIPDGTQKLADRISTADGLVIVSPEYNHGVPGPLKNAIDWLSRIRPFPTTGKPCFLASAAPGLVGGARGLIAMRPALSFMGAWISGESFSLAQANQMMAEGKIVNDELDQMLNGMLERFTKVTASLQIK
tara:strand:+ start:30 stop:635 length:606 start_codon:yes stop_codon:yes gene_type:complete